MVIFNFEQTDSFLLRLKKWIGRMFCDLKGYFKMRKLGKSNMMKHALKLK